jgi:uncharacterized protein YdeI (YjbR/CyaY-like superfamily)
MNTVHPKNRNEWRKWLAQTHSKEMEVGLFYSKKGSGKESVSYMESVEEAICFGWVDGIKNNVRGNYLIGTE